MTDQTNPRTKIVRHAAKVLDRASDPYVGYERLVQVLKDSRAGTPRAQNYDGDGGRTRVWCEEHERDVEACHKDGIVCSGVPDLTMADPTGEAATLSVDPAARDLERLDRLMKKLAPLASEFASLLDKHVPVKPREDWTPSEGWEPPVGLRAMSDSLAWFPGCGRCRHCDDLQGDEGRYKDHCRPCGDFNAAHGFYPTKKLLEIRSRGGRLTEAMVKSERPQAMKRRSA